MTFTCLAPVFIWFWRNMAASGVASNYLSQLAAANPYYPSGGLATTTRLWARFAQNIKSHFLDTAVMVGANLSYFPKPAMPIASAILWVFIATGFYHRVKKGFGITEIFSVFFVVMVIAWPFQGYRFMMPVYPFLFAYATEGAYYLSHKSKVDIVTSRKSLKTIFIILYLLVLTFNINVSIYYQQEMSKRFRALKFPIGPINFLAIPEEYDNLLKASYWLAQNRAPAGIVMTRNWRLVALASNHPVVECPMKVPDNPKEWLLKNDIGYIIVDEVYPNSKNYLRALAGNKEEGKGLITVFRMGQTYVIEVSPAFFSFGNIFDK